MSHAQMFGGQKPGIDNFGAAELEAWPPTGSGSAGAGRPSQGEGLAALPSSSVTVSVITSYSTPTRIGAR